MTEIIIDNLQAELTGTWQTSTFQPNYFGTNYHLANRSAASTLPRVAIWRPAIPEAGDYTVSVWLPDGGVNNDRSRAVKYRVHHSGTVTEFVIDQTVPGGYWRQLGRGPLPFAGSGDEFVELRVADVAAPANGSALYIHADAVRIATPPPALTVAPAATVSAQRNYVELSWPVLDGAAGYVVSREVDGQFTEIADQKGAAFLLLDLGLGETARFTVAGYNGAGLGPATSPIEAAVTPGAPLQAVQGIAISDDAGRPRLDWQPAGDATGYRVERAATSGGAFTTIAEVASPGYTDLVAPQRAHYRVRSLNAHGAAELSSWQVNWFTAVPVPNVVVNASSRCVGGRSVLTVTAQNAEKTPVDITIATPYGVKSFAGVRPGGNAFHAFTTRQTTMPAGAVTVDATTVIDGATLSSSTTASYGMRVCS